MRLSAMRLMANFGFEIGLIRNGSESFFVACQ